MKQRQAMDPSVASQTPVVVWPLIGRCLSDEPLLAFREISRRGMWEYAAAEACDAGVGAMLLDQAERCGCDVPRSAAGQMRAFREHAAAANAYKLACVRKVLVRLRIAGVEFLLLKGAALNLTVYEPGMRPMTDIDVLIHATDAATADKVLRNVGCTPGPDLVRPDFYPRYYCEREYFTRDHPPLKIDLHCRPFHVLRYAGTVPERAMWQEHRETLLGDLTVGIPGPEDMLIHLAVHASCHGGAELRWLYDLKAWIDRERGMDWDRLGDKCRRWQLTLPVRRALQRTQTAFGVCEGLSRAIEVTRGRAGPLERLALAGAPLARRAPLLHTLCNVLSTPGMRFRLGYLVATLFPDRSHLAQIYPRRHRGWTVAAHLLRIGRCLRRWVRPSQWAGLKPVPHH